MDEKPFESLNVIPFVDIMLVLLTMVLTTASFIAVGRIPLSLPKASPMKVEQDKPTMVEIDASGTIHLNGRALDVEALKMELASLPKDGAILIRADKSIPFQRFVDVADVLKQLAFTKVGVQTQGVRGGHPGGYSGGHDMGPQGAPDAGIAVHAPEAPAPAATEGVAP